MEGECGEWGGGHGEGKWKVGVEKMGWRGEVVKGEKGRVRWVCKEM